MSDTPQDTVPEGLTEEEQFSWLTMVKYRRQMGYASTEQDFEYLRKIAALRRERAEAREEVERLRGLLAEVREDGTGSLEGKRVWPIRAALHRRIAAELDNREVDAKTGFPKPAPDGEEATQGKED